MNTFLFVFFSAVRGQLPAGAVHSPVSALPPAERGADVTDGSLLFPHGARPHDLPAVLHRREGFPEEVQ